MIAQFKAATYLAPSLALALTLSGPAFAQSASMTSSMSAAGQATIKVLAENEKIVVRESISHPGEGTSMQSRLGTAYYYINGGTLERTFGDGTKDTVTRKSGLARISDEKRPFSTKNIGKTTIHVISFALKTNTSPAAAQMALAPMAPANGTRTLLAENDKVVIFDRVTPPGGGSGMGVSKPDVAYYVIKGGTYELTFADGTKTQVTHRSGEAYIQTETRPFASKNIGKAAIHQIIFRSK